jgi:hypothetical protein
VCQPESAGDFSLTKPSGWPRYNKGRDRTRIRNGRIMFTPRSSALTLASSLLAGLLASSASAADLDLPPPPPPPVVQQAPAPAPQPAVRGDFQATGGAYAVDNGYSDRAFMGLQGSLYDDSGFGVHMDAVHVQREEEAAFVAAGLSYAVTPGTRLKLMAGTSTDNLEIQPELYLNGSATFDLGPQAGLVITPEVIYRQYRSGTEEVQAQGLHLEILQAVQGWFVHRRHGVWLGDLRSAR